MIWCYAVVVALLAYSNSTDAGQLFDKNVDAILKYLRNEEAITVDKSSPTENLEDILCNQLTNDEKEDVCNQVRSYFVKDSHPDEFVSFVDKDGASTPENKSSGDSYACKDLTVGTLNIKKPMYWCKSKEFRKRGTIENGTLEGFFCAASREFCGRVFAFRQLTKDSEEVTPIGKVNYIDQDKLYGGFDSSETESEAESGGST